MPIVRQGDEGYWSLRDDDTAIVYMCGTDWQHHTLCDAYGTKVYGSEAALRRQRSCVSQCGVVEVEMRITRWVTPQDYSSAK